MVIINDLTEKMLNQQLKVLNEYKDQLLATVSHDLRSPLNGMLLYMKAAQEENDITKIRENLQMGINTSNLLQAMICDILDFTQIKQGKLRIVANPFRLEETLHEIKNIFDFMCKQKNLSFRLMFGQESLQDIVLENDSNRLKQVLFNLVNNAIKFTNKGSVSIEFWLEKLNEIDIIKIKVVDSGCGIPPSQ